VNVSWDVCRWQLVLGIGDDVSKGDSNGRRMSSIHIYILFLFIVQRLRII
jgi:hypothetical protein